MGCTNQCGPRLGAGFTLLELLVVLAIVGMLTALVAPRFARTLQAAQQRAELNEVVAQIAGLGYRAFALGTAIRLDAESASKTLGDGKPVLALPEGWTLKSDKPIRYAFSGYCEGGRLQIMRPQADPLRLRLEPPLCAPTTDDAN